MLTDRFGLPVSTTVPEAVEAINNFAFGFMGYELNIAEAVKAPTFDPFCGLANALCAMLHMLSETTDGPAGGGAFSQAALEHRSEATEREQLYVDQVVAWVAGDVRKTLELAEAIVRRFPTDFLALKIAQYHAFNLGDHRKMRELSLHVLAHASKHHPDYHYVLGMHAFALEQCGELAEAEKLGRQAAAMGKDPWAQHAVAHVMDGQGRFLECRDWLEEHKSTWTNLNSFMYTHLWWHLALCYIEVGEQGRALDIYDNHIWGIHKDFVQDQVNAASMLWRLALRSVDVGAERWADVADHAAVRVHDSVLPFLDLHFAMATIRARRTDDLKSLLESMEAKARDASLVNQRAWRMACSVATALARFADQDWARVCELLDPVMDQLVEVGGSHAQRDVFVQTHLVAMVKAGHAERARDMLRARVAKYDDSVLPKRGSPYFLHLLADVHRDLGQHADATRADGAARELERLYRPKM